MDSEVSFLAFKFFLLNWNTFLNIYSLKCDLLETKEFNIPKTKHNKIFISRQRIINLYMKTTEIRDNIISIRMWAFAHQAQITPCIPNIMCNNLASLKHNQLVE